MSAPTGDHPRSTVLVCEDEAPLRELMRVALEPSFSVLEATDGRRAVELARSASPDAVVLDLMLPRTSGLDVVRELRDGSATHRIGIVVVSAWTELEADAVAAGADVFLAKPFDPGELHDRVQELVRG